MKPVLEGGWVLFRIRSVHRNMSARSLLTSISSNTQRKYYPKLQIVKQRGVAIKLCLQLCRW